MVIRADQDFFVELGRAQVEQHIKQVFGDYLPVKVCWVPKHRVFIVEHKLESGREVAVPISLAGWTGEVLRGKCYDELWELVIERVRNACDTMCEGIIKL